MGRKNYLREIKSSRRAEQKQKHKVSWHEYLQAWLDFLRKPKTRFDLRERALLLVLLVSVIILLQMVVEYFSN